MSPAPRSVTAVGIVLPAHNEQDGIAAALAALGVAAAASPLPVHLAVVLDDCYDQTAARVRAADRSPFAAVHVVACAARNVGVARGLGAATVLATLPAASTWLATTDADTVVPAPWLTHQLAHQAAGADAVVGTVQLHPSGPLPAAARTAFQAAYDRHRRHVHGANLAVHAAAYRAVGGFAPLPVGEDAALVRALESAGHPIVWAADAPVSTSARLMGRAPAGVAADLALLAAGL